MDYIDAATTGIPLHHMYYLFKIWKDMLKHIEETLPSTMHLAISSDRCTTFLQISMHTHILIADEQFLLLIDVPIQDHAHSK